MIDLKNKVVVVTGGNGLIGSAIVKELLNKNSLVISVDLIPGVLHHDNLDQFICDLTDEKEVNKLFKYISTKYTKCDGWVNNAYPRTKDWGNKLEDVVYESWRKNVDMQLNSYFLCSQKALELMKPKKSGSLVNIASIYGVVGPNFNVYEGTPMTMPVAYSAIKGGVVNLTKYFASYYGKSRLRVNTVSPGGIFDNQPQKFVENYNKICPFGEMGTKEDVAKAVTYLLSDYSSYISGHNLIVDGAWTSI